MKNICTVFVFLLTVMVAISAAAQDQNGGNDYSVTDGSLLTVRDLDLSDQVYVDATKSLLDVTNLIANDPEVAYEKVCSDTTYPNGDVIYVCCAGDDIVVHYCTFKICFASGNCNPTICLFGDCPD